MTDITIENMVISTRVADSIDLEHIANNLPDVEYQPQNIPGIVIQLTTPRATIILFKDGRITFTGAKTTEQINDIINTIQSKLLIVGVPRYTHPEINIEHIVASTNIGRHLSLSNIAKSLPYTEYNPKKFPGVIYRTDDPNTIILLFDSGKVVCNGKNQDIITNQIEKLTTKLTSMGLVTYGGKK
jgi:transcription initiation factor TFIID TATA-box-binding protein